MSGGSESRRHIRALRAKSVDDAKRDFGGDGSGDGGDASVTRARAISGPHLLGVWEVGDVFLEAERRGGSVSPARGETPASRVGQNIFLFLGFRYYKRLLSEETSRGEMGEGCAGDALRDDVDEIHLGGCERRAVRSARARGVRGARGALTWSPSRQKCFSAQSTMYSLGGVPSTGMSTWRRGTGGGSSRASASEAVGICDDGGGRGEPRAERVVVVSEGTQAASGPGGARTDHDRHGDLGRFVRDARAHPLGLLRGLLRLRHSRGRRGGKAARRTRRARV